MQALQKSKRIEWMEQNLTSPNLLDLINHPAKPIRALAVIGFFCQCPSSPTEFFELVKLISH